MEIKSSSSIKEAFDAKFGAPDDLSQIQEKGGKKVKSFETHQISVDPDMWAVDEWFKVMKKKSIWSTELIGLYKEQLYDFCLTCNKWFGEDFKPRTFE